MARLTRMQKYAERRKEMANENEATQTTPALDPYKDKLDALVANFNNSKKEEKEIEVDIKPIEVEEPLEEVKEETPSFEEVTKEFNPINEEKEDDILSSLDTDNIDKAIDDLFNQKLAILEDEKPAQEEVVADTKIEDEVKDVLEETKQEEPVEVIEGVKEEVVEPITEVEEPVEEEVTYPTPVKEEEDINVIDEDYNEIASKLFNEVEELDGKVEPLEEEKEEPVVVREAPVKEPEVVNIIDQDYVTIANSLANIVEELDGKVEPVKEEEKVLPKVEVKEEPVVEEVNVEEISEVTPIEEPVLEPVEEVKEEVSEVPEIEAVEPIEEISVDEILAEAPASDEKSNDYVDETLKEVEEYNKQDGRKTADDVKDMIVDDIRHNKPEDIDNEEFANTVSLEIDKVLNAINLDTPSIDVADVTLDEVLTPIEEVSTEEVADKLADTIEHPVLAKVSEEEPIEIKSMEETLTSDVVDDTIPFMMDDVKEDKEVVYEEMDDEKPNKILNIILVVLIVILLVILGVITYYLLYAKGIIG